MTKAIDRQERLQAYFDDELKADDRAAVERDMAADSTLRGQIENLRFTRAMVTGGLSAQAESVHEARFEQIWEGFDRQVDRESRLQHAADSRLGIAGNLVKLLRSIRVPVLAAAAGAAAVVFFVRDPGESEQRSANKFSASASNESATQTPSEAIDVREPVAHLPLPLPLPLPLIAEAGPPSGTVEDELFTMPESNNAEIETIEFGGLSGSVAQIEGTRGTTTVIWVVEDEELIDSERSL